jgi:hypothetical protein
MGLFGKKVKAEPVTVNAKAMIQQAKAGIGHVKYGWQFDVENYGGLVIFMPQHEYTRIVAGAIGELTYIPGKDEFVSFKRTGVDPNAPKNPFGM